MTEPKHEPWKVDKKVPVALIVSIVIAFTGQTFAFGFWAATTSEQLRNTSSRLDQLEKKIEATAPQAIALAEVKVKVDGLTQSMAEIKDILRQRPAVR